MDGMTKGKVIEFTLPIEPLSSNPRTIWVYLPANYETSNETYPVLYMFDGHNLFFEELSYAGTTWGMKDYLDTTGTKLIVVGQNCNHDGQERESEYCPFTPVKVKGWESTVKKGDITADWFVNTLKPYCEKHFRVSTKREDIGIGGSSMGGLMGDYMAAKYSDVIGNFACLSPATEFAPKRCLSFIKKQHIHPNTRIYRSFGSEELRGRRKEMKAIELLLQISNAFIDKGCIVHTKLHVGEQHNEAAWAKLVPEFIPFLFPDLCHIQ